MPVLHQNRDGSGYTLEEVCDDATVVHDLRPEGAQILLNVYGVKVGGTVEAETLEKLVGLRLAALRPAEEPPGSLRPSRWRSPSPSPNRRPSGPGRRRLEARPHGRAPAGPGAPPAADPRAPRSPCRVLYRVEQNPTPGSPRPTSTCSSTGDGSRRPSSATSPALVDGVKRTGRRSTR